MDDNGEKPPIAEQDASYFPPQPQPAADKELGRADKELGPADKELGPPPPTEPEYSEPQEEEEEQYERPIPFHGDSDLEKAHQEDEAKRARYTRPPLRRQYTKLANKKANPWQHLGITLGGPMIVLFDIVVPCIIYYSWYDSQARPRRQFDKDILGSAIASFGVGELWILFARVYRLFVHREQCAPLLSRNRWELDATSWVYGVAMICALIPFVVGSSLVIPHLYLYSPAFIMAFLGALMFITTFIPFKIPIGINSHARGTQLRPFIYYAAEDFVAVDGLQDREFRVRYNERYETNKAFRRLFRDLTLWWMLGVCVYIGCLSAVIWTVEFHIAFGLSLGILFAYIALWAAGTFAWVSFEMGRQRKAYEKNQVV